jgi:hypothetical protein
MLNGSADVIAGMKQSLSARVFVSDKRDLAAVCNKMLSLISRDNASDDLSFCVEPEVTMTTKPLGFVSATVESKLSRKAHL